MDDLQRSLLNVFSASDLDRMVPRRKDDSWLDRLVLDGSSRFIPFHKGRFLMSEGEGYSPVWLARADLHDFIADAQVQIFLGERRGHSCFAVDIAAEEIIERFSSGRRSFADLRQYGGVIGSDEASILSYAKALFHWHRDHRFCGRCGSATQQAQAGHVRVCGSESCARVHFPRTDPAVIVAVTHGERCLFGRQAGWAPNRYSVVAGFVEPGESVEQAVVREVREETDIDLGRVRYRSSQPWPFPGSIMLGFQAEAISDEIRLNDGELQDAHWRDAREVVAGLVAGEFLVPPKLSIAYRLIEDWFNSHSAEGLAEVLDRTGRRTDLLPSMRS